MKQISKYSINTSPKRREIKQQNETFINQFIGDSNLNNVNLQLKYGKFDSIQPIELVRDPLAMRSKNMIKQEVFIPSPKSTLPHIQNLISPRMGHRTKLNLFSQSV